MIKKEEVQHIANLARLGFTPKEEELFQKNLTAILDYFKSLQKVSTLKTEPAFHPNEQLLKSEQVLREDKAEPAPSAVREKIIKGAPAIKDNYLKVKAIL